MARFATVARMPPPFRHRTTEKEFRRSPQSATLEERIEERRLTKFREQAVQSEQGEHR